MKKVTGFWAIFAITGLITHIWTAVIAYSESGFLAFIFSLFIPVLSEIYWMCAMIGENNTYVFVSLIHTVLAVIFVLMQKENNTV